MPTDPNQIIVRRALPEDREACIAMRCALWPQCPRDHHADEFDGANRAAFRTQILVAQCAARLLGFAELRVRPLAEGHDGPVVYIEGIWVEADARRRGVARRLLVAAQEWAVAQGFSAMASDCQLDNDATIRMHHELGFHEVERSVHFLKRLH